jgi:predicted nuclease of predicted toxin-antitoxin system
VVDAQLPRRLARWLREQGHDAVHTLELPSGNRTSDADLCELADVRGAVIVTKDADFVVSRTLHGTPARLLIVTTGNISNAELLRVVARSLGVIEEVFVEAALVEVDGERVVVRA